MNVETIQTAILAVLAAQSDKMAKQQGGRESEANASDCLRRAAKLAHDAGMPAKTFGALYELEATVKGVKANTIKVYKQAACGYVHELSQGRDIFTGYGKGENLNKAMPVNKAKDAWNAANMTEEEKETAKQEALLKERQDAIIARVKAMTFDELGLLLDSELLPKPQADDSVTTKTARQLAAEAKAAAERAAAEAARDELYRKLEQGETESETAQAA